MNRKRIVSLLLALLMIFSMIPFRPLLNRR